MAIRKMAETTLCKKLNLTPEGLKELRRAAQQTWQYIAYDILQATYGPETEFEGRGIPRAQVIEIVLDADHITTANYNLSPEVKTALSHAANVPYEVLQSALLEAFPFKSYGY